MEKKKQQLGMNPSTASARLVKDLLWDFIVKCKKDSCVKCGKPMTRDTFSIEHIVPWLDSDDPRKNFFDVENIGYSHLSCNISDARKPKAEHGSWTMYCKFGCRCDLCKNVNSERRAAVYTKEKRRSRYKRTGN
ncbi:hypothetical protein [Salmonella phage NINP13076]|uniref:HNH endonuclease n=1 Tax=Salmonella phage SalP219 TaxID=3158864 RepID=A0AAU7PI64_9CAUD|nr:hypothetical protein [Salmonella phage NINP13076]